MAADAASHRDDFVLLDDGFAADGGRWLLQRPERIIACRRPDSVGDALAAIDAAVDGGFHAAGYFAYELGYALEPRLRPLLPPDLPMPLLRVGLFREARRLDAAAARRWLDQRIGGSYTLGPLRPTLDAAGYGAAFAAVREFIAAGDVYQINLTFKQRFAFTGDAIACYRDLCRRQRVGHGALLRAGGWHILSLSPELFVRLADGELRVRPMKGTAGRGVTPEEDAGQRAWLAADEKSRAENLMIVDLLRNDVGRLAPPGRVRVTDLFTVETLRSLHQMTSGIAATLGPPPPSLAELLRALFPCGSVTGAPKIRAMELIRALEAEPRGVYTGAIGLIAPGGRMLLNVAIRTLVIAPDGGGELGIGSGVVFDSDAVSEYDECQLKARFLTAAEPPFALIETLKWQRGAGYVLLGRHLDRLAASAAHFAIPCARAEVAARLTAAAAGFADEAMRVRLLLDEDGVVAITAAPLEPLPAVLRYAVSPRPMSSREPFRYHKTTRR
ncbi:MAG: aminodeoxychorismate synthase component I, partial [Rhodospirillales bacterium]|nr:aminodeoxychorismate synthase component I [Rhodospirillales bacterium]